MFSMNVQFSTDLFEAYWAAPHLNLAHEFGAISRVCGGIGLLHVTLEMHPQVKALHMMT